MQSRLQWDDLVYVLAVSRAGSLAGAARNLRVNHSTVFRRIAALEAALGARLFDRHRDGYVPTVAGEETIALAGEVEEQVLTLERHLSGEDLRPKGVVRLTTSEGVSPTVTGLCALFRRDYPEIRIELTTGFGLLDLARREADVAIRASRGPPENLHGRRIASIGLCVYASSRYLATRGNIDCLRDNDWIGMDSALSNFPGLAYIRANADPERLGFTTTSFLSARDAALADMGLALLPCYLGDPHLDLKRIGEPIPELSSDLWLLVHEDLRRAARIRAFTDYLWEGLRKLRPLIEGKGLRSAE